jgi:hypothetical protein
MRWEDTAEAAADRLATKGRAGLRAALPAAVCRRWLEGVVAARSSWTAAFDGEQFSLGRAFYTDFEEGTSSRYFSASAASDAAVERAVPGLQGALRALAARLVRGNVRPRRGWCGPGVHVFPAGGHVATRGGVVHFDTEGLTRHQLTRRARAFSVVVMLQPPERGGGLRVWEATYAGKDAPSRQARATASVRALYGVGDAVVIDSYRLHQIEPFAGGRDRVSATVHLAEVDDGEFESWF